MPYSLFPGCSLDSSAKTYRTSLDWTLSALEIEVTELRDWNCCGATSTHALDTAYVDLVPARNLVLAEAEQRDLLVACSACYHRLKRAHQALSEHTELRERAASVLGKPLTMEQRVCNVLEVLAADDILDRLRQQSGNNWNGVRVGSYYGCLAVRLPGTDGFDDPENPMSMDHLVEAVDAIPVDWPHKTHCCGASLAVTGPKYAQLLCDKILGMARRFDLDLLVTACPFCQYNLDIAQWNAETGQQDRNRQEESIPIVFITQFLGIALGASPEEMGLGSNLAGVERLTKLSRRIDA